MPSGGKSKAWTRSRRLAARYVTKPNSRAFLLVNCNGSPAGLKTSGSTAAMSFFEFIQAFARDVLGADFGLYGQDFQGGIQHAEGQRHGQFPPPAGNVAIGGAHRVADLALVDARRADGGVGGHDNVVAGHHRQYGMAFNRLRQIGHGLCGVKFLAGQKLGQFIAGPEVAAPAEIFLAGGNVKLEDQIRLDVL